MSALTVTLGADITALRRAMAGATELVSASARRMGKMTRAGLAGLGKGGSAALSKGFAVTGITLKACIGAALTGGTAAMGVGVKAVNSAADFEQTKVAFTTLIGDAAKAEETLAKLRKRGAETPFEFPELADAGRKLIAFGEVFLALGTPINDAIRPLVAEAINLVSQLAPTAAEAGKNVKDGIMFIIAAFKSGLVLELVTASLKLGFAVAINSLINGFRAAVSFLFFFISNVSMWKGLGTVLLGLAGSFGLALLNAFETPITYLKAGIEWCVAWMLKGLLKVPGMSKLMGIGYGDVNSSFKDILKDANANRGKLFGIDYKELQETNTGFIETGMSNIGTAASESARRAKEGGFTDMFDTVRLREGMSDVIKSIVDTMPKAEEAKKAATAVSQTTTGPVVKPEAKRLDPIVTSLGKVGGGGYSSGMLDAQRENNRLTGETNRLLKDMNRTIGNLGGSGQAAFG